MAPGNETVAVTASWACEAGLRERMGRKEREEKVKKEAREEGGRCQHSCISSLTKQPTEIITTVVIVMNVYDPTAVDIGLSGSVLSCDESDPVGVATNWCHVIPVIQCCSTMHFPIALLERGH